MLNIEKIDKYFGQNCLFKDASLLIHPNEKIGLVGPNGSGKTTLFRLIEGTQEVDSGKIEIVNKIRIGVLRQELEESQRNLLFETIEGDPELTQLLAEQKELQKQLEENLTPPPAVTNRMGEIDHRLEEIDAFRAESRAGAILLGLGFKKDDLTQPLSAFSGGWRMRVALARLLFSRADLLLLDEPTNHLDLESVAWLEKHLANMAGTIIIISHDRGFLNRVSKITIALENHTLIRYVGSYDSYEKQRDERRRLLIKSAEKQDQEIEQIEKFINRFRAQANKAKQVQSRIKHLEKIVRVERPTKDPVAPVIRLPTPPPCAHEVLALRGISKQFGDNLLFKKQNLTLQKGKKIGLLGPNGAGKSSLLKIITSTLTPDEGSVIVGDRVKIAHFAQHTLESLNPEQTIIESAQESAPKNCLERELRTILGGFLFSGDTVFKGVSVLSGGEKARLALARMFLSGANVLLLDEPTNHLDMGARAALQKALQSYGGTLIIITHDRDLMEGVCDNFWVVGNEKVAVWEYDLKSYLEQVTDIVGESKTAILDGKTEKKTGSKLGNKELRQESARIRQVLSKATQKAKKRIAVLEKEIQTMESTLKEIEDKLADPQIHNNPDKNELKELVAQSGRLNSSLIESMAQWEDLSLEIEEHEEQAQNALAELK
ncbi:MAG: ABC-F family ATP-binding cassette domain-containing protein [Magnetococcales bacterium]|nr:ABC-F family ATP-binding cassette domain-containing protein [Magnetococcales bacterium]